MQAKPILSLTLLAAALALPGTAASLGLGRLTLQSSLGQPLSAQIELTSVAKEELDSLSARVAEPSLYRQNNLAYQGVLSRARVAVERLPSGEAVLKVTTSSNVTEPYLDLLVEINWASGRVVRAYTFLLDPPGTPAPVATTEPITPPRVGAGRPSTASAEGRPTGEGRAPGGAGNSYTVRRGDTLSKIAGEFKPPNATLEQMLVALFANNSGAFDGNNMNRLRAGAILSIPSANEVAGAPADEATKTVRTQATDWRSYRDRVAGSAPEAEAAGSRAAGGRIGTTVEEPAGPSASSRDQLRLSREAAQGKGGLSAAQEEVIARDKALKEAQARITELEKTLRDLQRAMDMKGQAGTPTTPAPSLAQADAAKSKAPEPAKAEPPKAGVPIPPPPVAEPPKATAPEPPKAAAPEPPKAAPPPSEPPKIAEPPKPTPAPPPKAVAPKADATKAPPKVETSLIDDFVSNTPVWAIGAGALAVLGGIAALIAARRRKTVKFEDSIIGGSEIKTNTVFGSTGGGVVNTGENSLATDFSREGLGNIDTDEVDPIAEAEVYLAYGRDAQAEEILKDALKKDNQRQEIYLKLLEIHAQHNKPSAFETVAAELYSVSKGHGEVWQKAVTLGRQVDPNNPMFSEGGAAASAAAGAAMTSARAAQSSAGSREPTAPATASHSIGKDVDADDALDFRFDEDVSISRTRQTTKAQIDKIDAAEREFEESSQRAATSTNAAVGAAAGAAIGAAAGLAAKAGLKAEPAKGPPSSFDFETDEGEEATPSHKPAGAPAERTEEDLVSRSLAKPQAAVDLDKLELSFDPEHASFEDPTPSVLSGQWHDAATKLDLAKAYQEMGDVEGAREILQEVLHEGDEQQKSEAQSLLTKLG